MLRLMEMFYRNFPPCLCIFWDILTYYSYHYNANNFKFIIGEYAKKLQNLLKCSFSVYDYVVCSVPTFQGIIAIDGAHQYQETGH